MHRYLHIIQLLYVLDCCITFRITVCILFDREQPFHLSRRGWGEFPLRVQIHFQCSANKPVDVIHNLKLDRTYTGRQTLGKS